MTRETFEKSLRIWMIVFGITFVIADLNFLLGREPLFRFINWEAGLMNLPDSPAPDGNLWFFLALSNSMMVMLVYLSFSIAANPWKNLNYLPVIIVSKFTSSLTALTFYFATRCHTVICVAQAGDLNGAPYYSNLVIFTSDLPLGIIAFVLYRMATKYTELAKPMTNAQCPMAARIQGVMVDD